jgi:hypothetical protein
MTIVGIKRMIVYDDIASHEKIKIYDARVEVPPHYPRLRVDQRQRSDRVRDGHRARVAAWAAHVRPHEIRDERNTAEHAGH